MGRPQHTVCALIAQLACVVSGFSFAFGSAVKKNTAHIATAHMTSVLPRLLDSTGNQVDASRLHGKRVALYFSAGWCPMCTSFEPALSKFRDAAEAAGNPIECIYVSSDRSTGVAAKRAYEQGMLQVPFDEADELKRRHNVWAGSECFKFGFGRRSGVPALVVLGPIGNEIAFVDAERRGPKALEKWPAGGMWGPS